MKIASLIVFCLFISGCAAKYDERLIGTWQSNRERTVTKLIELKPDRAKMTPEKKEKFANIFGHMIHTYSKDTITTTYKDDTQSAKYEVLEAGEDYVVVKTYFCCQDPEEYKLRFENDLKSFWTNEGTSFPEVFTKIEKMPSHALKRPQ